MKRLVVGDIHGAYIALAQCLARANFNEAEDRLIVLGDVCDGWPETKRCVDYLLRVKDLIYVIGNHDEWTLRWMTEPREIAWDSQGGKATFHSYVPKEHIDFFINAHLWHEENEQLFVHGGINPSLPLHKQDKDTCLWDRNLIRAARHKHNQKPDYRYLDFRDIFIGHTTTLNFNSELPLHYCNVRNLDTGGGWEGKLTIMDADTYEFWQSDFVKTLYPEVRGRF